MRTSKRRFGWVELVAAVGAVTILSTVCGCPGRSCESAFTLEVRYENADTQPVHLFRASTETAAMRRLEALTFDTATYGATFYEPVSGLQGSPESEAAECERRKARANANPQTWTFNAVRGGVVVGTASVVVTYAEVEANRALAATVHWDGTTLTATR